MGGTREWEERTEVRVGERRQRWRTVCRVGEGTYGQVYVVQRGGTRVGALKLYRADRAGHGRADMSWEARVLSHLEKRGAGQVVRMLASGEAAFETGEDGGERVHPGVLMEILHPRCPSVGSLVELSDDRKLDVGLATRIGLQSLRGLHEMHKYGLVHRDIKPDNLGILPRPNDHTCVLIDLGMARFYTREDGGLDAPRSLPGEKGTPAFMSGRVLVGRECGRVDDLWSWFFTLVELCKGMYRMPWDELGVGCVGRSGKKPQMVEDHLLTKSRLVASDLILKGLPPQFYAIRIHLLCLGHDDAPNYSLLLYLLSRILINIKTQYPAQSLIPTDLEKDTE